MARLKTRKNLYKHSSSSPVMIDRQDFKNMKDEFKQLDDKHEEIIRRSREVIRISKQLIYSVHRDDMKEAELLSKKIKTELMKLRQLNSGNLFEQHERIAVQEYVEALCFYGVVKHRKLPTSAELGVSAEHYLLGLCDLGGELVRKAINAAIKGKYGEALWIKDLMTEVYGMFLQFDFRNGELRKKFDGMKYDLKKLEDLALQIALKEDGRRKH